MTRSPAEPVQTAVYGAMQGSTGLTAAFLALGKPRVGGLLLALLLVTLQQRQPLASDTLLGILAHSTLSLGLVTLSFMPEVRIDLMSYLFGDLLAVSREDLYWIVAGSALPVATLLTMFPFSSVWEFDNPIPGLNQTNLGTAWRQVGLADPAREWGSGRAAFALGGHLPEAEPVLVNT